MLHVSVVSTIGIRFDVSQGELLRSIADCRLPIFDWLQQGSDTLRAHRFSTSSQERDLTELG